MDINLDKLPARDSRNHGQKKIYFYLRKSDNRVFAIDNELQASHLHRQKQFPQMYHYLGWTNGEEYQKKTSELSKELEAQIREEIKEEGIRRAEERQEFRYRRMKELTDENQEKIYKLLVEEAKRAQENPGSQQTPRDFRAVDREGNPLPDNNLIAQSLKMFR